MIVGAGSGLEGVTIMEQSKNKGAIEIFNVDILQWPQVSASTVVLNVVVPGVPFLGPVAERVHVLIASISASRSLIHEIPYIIKKMIEAMSQGGSCVISENDSTVK